MKRLACAMVMAAFASGLHAANDSTQSWFGNGLAWYQHPCGWDAFAKYGQLDRPEVRHNYFETIRHPELCSKLFP